MVWVSRHFGSCSECELLYENWQGESGLRSLKQCDQKGAVVQMQSWLNELVSQRASLSRQLIVKFLVPADFCSVKLLEKKRNQSEWKSAVKTWKTGLDFILFYRLFDHIDHLLSQTLFESVETRRAFFFRLLHLVVEFLFRCLAVVVVDLLGLVEHVLLTLPFLCQLLEDLFLLPLHGDDVTITHETSAMWTYKSTTTLP